MQPNEGSRYVSPLFKMSKRVSYFGCSGAKDKWYVRHMCEKRDREDGEDVGWEWSSQVPASNPAGKETKSAERVGD